MSNMPNMPNIYKEDHTVCITLQNDATLTMLPTFTIPAVRTNDHAPDAFENIALLCPRCGTLWARITLTPPVNFPPRKWNARVAVCTSPQCETFDTATELRAHLPYSQLEHCPLPVLKFDFNHLAQAATNTTNPNPNRG